MLDSVQSNHMTLVHHYNDTQDYVVYEDTETSTTVKVVLCLAIDKQRVCNTCVERT